MLFFIFQLSWSYVLAIKFKNERRSDRFPAIYGSHQDNEETVPTRQCTDDLTLAPSIIATGDIAPSSPQPQPVNTTTESYNLPNMASKYMIGPSDPLVCSVQGDISESSDSSFSNKLGYLSDAESAEPSSSVVSDPSSTLVNSDLSPAIVSDTLIEQQGSSTYYTAECGSVDTMVESEHAPRPAKAARLQISLFREVGLIHI